MSQFAAWLAGIGASAVGTGDAPLADGFTAANTPDGLEVFGCAPLAGAPVPVQAQSAPAARGHQR